MSKEHNCKECKYCSEKKNGRIVCIKNNREVPAHACAEFDKLKFCNTCKYAKALVYENETVERVDYRCMFQVNKIVYSDTNPMCINNSVYPECILDMYEEDA